MKKLEYKEPPLAPRACFWMNAYFEGSIAVIGDIVLDAQPGERQTKPSWRGFANRKCIGQCYPTLYILNLIEYGDGLQVSKEDL